MTRCIRFHILLTHLTHAIVRSSEAPNKSLSNASSSLVQVRRSDGEVTVRNLKLMGSAGAEAEPSQSSSRSPSEPECSPAVRRADSESGSGCPGRTAAGRRTPGRRTQPGSFVNYWARGLPRSRSPSRVLVTVPGRRRLRLSLRMIIRGIRPYLCHRAGP
eukprot:766382-Hanusia_phi.AAC.1